MAPGVVGDAQLLPVGFGISNISLKRKNLVLYWVCTIARGTMMTLMEHDAAPLGLTMIHYEEL